ncbi:MAG: hypothetical protein A2Y95_05680 [Deltaproteobacteria bacterium RBG_13_65_10]|jgi:uncharacterized protein with HEPN domain|nr:MAG: hypothetical protein A2Y95_05680 [Deltaproteobacteria bacterium RBG_13_65_10]
MSNDTTYLLDMLDAARLAVEYAEGKTLQAFKNDTLCQDAIVRRLTIIGEAARRVSKETRNLLSGIPWVRIVGMRNLMVHVYDEVDLDLVWGTVQNDLPVLIAELARHVGTEEA